MVNLRLRRRARLPVDALATGTLAVVVASTDEQPSALPRQSITQTIPVIMPGLVNIPVSVSGQAEQQLRSQHYLIRDAIGALGEALTIARRLWSESTPFDFEGARYRLTGAARCTRARSSGLLDAASRATIA